MTFRQIIGRVIYNLIGKHMPLSDSRYSLGSKRLRAWCGRRILLECGKNVNIEKGAVFAYDVKLGDNSGIGVNASISSGVTIGNDVMMGPECIILTTNHGMLDNGIPMWQQHSSEIRPVIIGDNCWIGSRVIILPGVTLDEGCVIGAGSVVTKNFGKNCIIAGNPAHLIKHRAKE